MTYIVTSIDLRNEPNLYAPEGSVNGRNVKDGLMVVALSDSPQHGGTGPP